ncbi:hypothetical protein AY599_17785 [Leptolyngbya valderiana BDU 20041]|nr:hypothetical protein AY599_17785 [Leptolyngbya valderiana BDU 20041]
MGESETTVGSIWQAAGGFLSELFAREPLFAGAALALAILAVPTAITLLLDPRTLDGAAVWLKPLKFEISLVIFLLTLAWFAGWLPHGVTEQDWYRVYSPVVVGCIALEMLWIGAAATFGLRSHFNVDTAFLRAVYPFMGLIAVVLTSACLVYGVLILGDGGSPLSPAVRHAVGLGLILTFVATVVVAGTMARSSGAAIAGTGGASSGAGWLVAVTGWRGGTGDLRPAHFLATHAMQAVPLVGWLVARAFPASAAIGAIWTLAIVWMAALLYAAVVGYLFLAALRERAMLTVV